MTKPFKSHPLLKASLSLMCITAVFSPPCAVAKSTRTYYSEAAISRARKLAQTEDWAKAKRDDAVKRAVARASQTVRQLRWFQVLDTRGHIEDGEIAHWQVTIKVGFTLEED